MRDVVEVGGAVHTGIDRFDGHVVVRPVGPLSLSTALTVRTSLARHLAVAGAVLVDLSGLRLGRAAAVAVFPAALRATGGWPAARMVLFGADAEMRAALRTHHVPEWVPLAADRAAARLRLDSPPAAVTRHFDLADSPAAGSFARSVTHAACHDWRVPHLAPDAGLIAGELVMNAVEHARSSPRMTVGLRGTDMTVSVRDDDLRCPAVRPQLRCVGEPGGWGLLMVTALSTQWGVTTHDDGKTVWARLSTEAVQEEPDDLAR